MVRSFPKAHLFPKYPRLDFSVISNSAQRLYDRPMQHFGIFVAIFLQNDET
jgi:hypothetical protein